MGRSKQSQRWPQLFKQQPVLGMSLRKVTSLGSNLASVTDFKRIETPHSLCCDFGGYKTFTTRWSGGRVQVWVQVRAPAGHLAISFNGQALGAAHRLCLRGSDGRAQTQGVSESAAVAAGSLEENMLPLLRYWLSSRVNKVLMLCKFRAATSHFFLSCAMKFRLN